MAGNAPNRVELMDIITTVGCIQLLEPFLYRPGIDMYQSELIKFTGVPLNRALRLLNLLVSHGILQESVKAGSKFYRVSLDNSVLKQLKILNIISKLYDAARGFSGSGVEVYLFGSAAKGEDTENSDIDLLIIADIDRVIVDHLIDRVSGKLDRKVSPVVYTSLEYANLHNKEKAFYESVERYKIRVI